MKGSALTFRSSCLIGQTCACKGLNIFWLSLLLGTLLAHLAVGDRVGAQALTDLNDDDASQKAFDYNAHAQQRQGQADESNKGYKGYMLEDRTYVYRDSVQRNNILTLGIEVTARENNGRETIEELSDGQDPSYIARVIDQGCDVMLKGADAWLPTHGDSQVWTRLEEKYHDQYPLNPSFWDSTKLTDFTQIPTCQGLQEKVPDIMRAYLAQRLQWSAWYVAAEVVQACVPGFPTNWKGPVSKEAFDNFMRKWLPAMEDLVIKAKAADKTWETFIKEYQSLRSRVRDCDLPLSFVDLPDEQLKRIEKDYLDYHYEIVVSFLSQAAKKLRRLNMLQDAVRCEDPIVEAMEAMPEKTAKYFAHFPDEDNNRLDVLKLRKEVLEKCEEWQRENPPTRKPKPPQTEFDQHSHKQSRASRREEDDHQRPRQEQQRRNDKDQQRREEQRRQDDEQKQKAQANEAHRRNEQEQQIMSMKDLMQKVSQLDSVKAAFKQLQNSCNRAHSKDDCKISKEAHLDSHPNRIIFVASKIGLSSEQETRMHDDLLMAMTKVTQELEELKHKCESCAR